MKGAILKLVVAALICLTPFALVWKLAGKEGLIVFLVIVGVFVAGLIGLTIAHWAIETVLVALGFDKDKINTDRSNTTFIFWGN